MPSDVEEMDISEPGSFDNSSSNEVEINVAPPVNVMDDIPVAPPPMLSPIHSLGGSSETASSSSAVAPPFGAPAPIEIAFSFDTTGSMSSCLEEIQNNLKTIINRLLMDIPALKTAIIAHGDYCDAEHFYVTKTLDFTNNVNDLFDFVTNCGGTGGGDYEECYELVMNKIRLELTWTPGTTKSIVMIGDAIPHPPGHGGNTAQLDWREEADSLYTQLGARVYAVQCLGDSNPQATSFWEELSRRTFGKHLLMDQFETVVELMMAICYKEGGNPHMFEAYEREIRAREGAGMRRDLDRMFNTLRDGVAPSGEIPTPKIAHVAPRIAAGVAIKAKTSPEVKNLTTNTHALKFKKPHRIERNEARRVALGKRRVNKLQKTHTPYVHRKLMRENVIKQHFVLNDLIWSPWKFYCNRSGKKNKLFNHQKDRAAVYEISVQPEARCKRYVTMFRATSGIPSGVNWDGYILRGKETRQQLNSVLAAGCNVEVRRALLPKVYKHGGVSYRTPRQFTKLLKSLYHYAWMRAGKNGQSPREIIRRGRIISKAMPVA